MPEPELRLIMHRDERHRMQLWACRGAGKGCPRNKHRRSKTPCADCFGPLPPNWTLEQVQRRLKQGDA